MGIFSFCIPVVVPCHPHGGTWRSGSSEVEIRRCWIISASGQTGRSYLPFLHKWLQKCSWGNVGGLREYFWTVRLQAVKLYDALSLCMGHQRNPRITEWLDWKGPWRSQNHRIAGLEGTLGPPQFQPYLELVFPHQLKLPRGPSLAFGIFSEEAPTLGRILSVLEVLF